MAAEPKPSRFSGMSLGFRERSDTAEVPDHLRRLSAARHRLAYVHVTFSHGPGELDWTEEVLDDLEFKIENYLYGASALRDRALLAVAHGPAVANGRKFVDRLRRPNSRHRALGELAQARPRVAATLRDLLEVLNDDIHDRNALAHSKALALTVDTGVNVVSYDTFLTDDHPGDSDEKHEFLRQQILQLSSTYQAKATRLIRLADTLLAKLRAD